MQEGGVMTENNCHTCEGLCYCDIWDVYSGNKTSLTYYCDLDGKYDTGNIPDDIKIDNLDAPCKFHKPIKDKSTYIDDSFYNEDEHTFSLCEKHHIELHDVTMKEINEDGEYVTGIDLLDMTRETEKSIYEAFKISWTIL